MRTESSQAMLLQGFLPLLMLGSGCFETTAFAQETSSSLPVVTNITQLRQVAVQPDLMAYAIRLQGDIWWANAAQGRLVLRDASSAEALELELPGEFPQSGQQVRLEGVATVSAYGAVIRLGTKGPVVDNDGVHGITEKQGSIYLHEGQQPIRVEWFNGVEGVGLDVAYVGPGISRQTIPDAALTRLTDNQSSKHASGLNYRCYEVTGNRLPDFTALPFLTNGTTSNFKLPPLPRNGHVGVEFSGFLDVTVPGLYTFYLKSDDGSRLLVGQPTLALKIVGKAVHPKPQRLTIGQLVTEDEDRRWSEIEGKVVLTRQTETGYQLDVVAGAAHLLVELGVSSGLSVDSLKNARIRASGFSRSIHTPDGQNVAGLLLVPNAKAIEITEPASATPSANQSITNLTVLTTAGEVHALKRGQAQHAFPVRLHGVVTCVLPEHQSFTIQDSTRGIYVEDRSPARAGSPQIGDYLELEGTTDPGLFAPFVNATHVRNIGAGRLPEPIKPMWDQLNNGSLDAQQVELQGIVTEVRSNSLTLLARGGVINVALRLRDNASQLKGYENALVRIRGCLFASWDYLTHQVQMGDVRLYSADILVDQPPPVDLFASPRKTAAELLQFDPQAGVFQRVKVTGQIVHAREAEYFLLDGERGLRFVTKQPVALAIGELVDVVGFPDLLGSASPVLREAVVRKTGDAPLPKAKSLPAENLVRADYDATRAKVEGTLINVGRTKSDTTLELQNGLRTFVARLRDSGEAMPSLAIGSLLELTGVYAGLGGNRAAGQDIAAFELLLHSPADIKVVARPPWWTLKRLLVIVGALACVLAIAALWINQLHRQVEERTTELGAQIQERQRVEHQRAMEEERTRIAQDLHDELGSGITEMSMLAARAKSASAPDDKRERHLDQVGTKACELVTALDEIVWAMNPRHDSLGSLVSYFSLYADRFLGLANIAWKLEGPIDSAEQIVDSRHRHQLFLAFKEALTNVVRHSGATEARIGIRCKQGQVRMTIADNGRGLPDVRSEDMNGVMNMRARIEKLGGRFEIVGEHGRGTTVRFEVPAHYHS